MHKYPKSVHNLHGCVLASCKYLRLLYTAKNPIIKMGKKLVASKDLPMGHCLRMEDLAIKSPGDGLPPYEIDKIIGRVTLKELRQDEDVHFDLLNGAQGWKEASS